MRLWSLHPRYLDAKGLVALWREALLAQAVAERRERAVVLTGGCFQNTLLLGQAVQLLRAQGRGVFWPRRLPVNDGSLAAGQAAVVAGVWGG